VVILWNGGNVKASFLPRFPGELRWVAKFFHLDQLWSMFSPNPPHLQFWYIMDGTTVGGTKVELLKNGALYEFEYNEPNWDKPDPFHVAFKNHRWFKFFEVGDCFVIVSLCSLFLSLTCGVLLGVFCIPRTARCRMD
jgi:hypothetical protein